MRIELDLARFNSRARLNNERRQQATAHKKTTVMQCNAVSALRYERLRCKATIDRDEAHLGLSVVWMLNPQTSQHELPWQPRAPFHPGLSFPRILATRLRLFDKLEF